VNYGCQLLFQIIKEERCRISKSHGADQEEGINGRPYDVSCFHIPIFDNIVPQFVSFCAVKNLVEYLVLRVILPV
jgi:hypothetical protein